MMLSNVYTHQHASDSFFPSSPMLTAATQTCSLRASLSVPIYLKMTSDSYPKLCLCSTKTETWSYMKLERCFCNPLSPTFYNNVGCYPGLWLGGEAAGPHHLSQGKSLQGSGATNGGKYQTSRYLFGQEAP